MQDDIKQFLKQYKFRPNDLLGQNFLINQTILQDIVAAAEIKNSDEVLEIGPGIGNLTKLLAQKAGFVLAVEKDPRYLPILKEQLGARLQSFSKNAVADANVRVVFADIMRFNFQEVLNPGYKVVANIPYYISGQIIEMLLTAKNKPSKIILLLQKEVAQRITAKQGDLSILAISVQLFASAKIISLVKKEEFYPQPKVDSAILSLDLLARPKYNVAQKKFFGILRACFSGKRKQIHNTLKNNLKLSDAQIDEALTAAQIDFKARPQDLSLKNWYAIYGVLKKNR